MLALLVSKKLCFSRLHSEEFISMLSLLGAEFCKMISLKKNNIYEMPSTNKEIVKLLTL